MTLHADDFQVRLHAETIRARQARLAPSVRRSQEVAAELARDRERRIEGRCALCGAYTKREMYCAQHEWAGA